jgi:hypothetical protein
VKDVGAQWLHCHPDSFMNSRSHERFEEDPRCVLRGGRKDREPSHFDQTSSSSAEVPSALLEDNFDLILNVGLKIMLAPKGLDWLSRAGDEAREARERLHSHRYTR